MPAATCYRVAVIAGDDSKRVLYRSEPEATIECDSARRTVPLLPEPFGGPVHATARARSGRCAQDATAMPAEERPAAGG